MRIPSGLVHQGQLDAEIREAASKLAPDVVHLKYRLGEDLTGDPSIFFRIVLADSSSAESTLADVTGRVAATLFDEIRPFENWGLHPYFNFRSQSEQQRLHDPEWE